MVSSDDVQTKPISGVTGVPATVQPTISSTNSHSTSNGEKMDDSQNNLVVNGGNGTTAVNDEDEEELPLIAKWSVTEVCDFIRNLPGCSNYAEDFAIQEIDGQALLLLKENHLVNAMGMRLGPALKIVAKVESMRVSNSNQTNGDNQ